LDEAPEIRETSLTAASRRRRCRAGWPAVVGAVLASTGASALAQEMEPRSYAPSPTGLQFVTATLSQSSGGVAIDPTLPIDDVEATINAATLGYLRTFGLFGRTASLGGGVPYVWGRVSGDVFEERTSIRRSGLGDPRLRLAVNLLGGPARTREEFAAQPRSTGIGASLTVALPTGEYDPDKLINIGANRWAAKTELGLYQPVGPWSFELAGGAWFFQDNDDYFGGVRKEQDPVTSVQGHVSYTFRRNLWLAANATYYWGGRTTVDGVRSPELQRSSRVGLTMSVPLTAQYSVKLAWSSGVTTRIGADFTTYGLTVQRAW
jgi:hypothetical protein